MAYDAEHEVERKMEPQNKKTMRQFRCRDSLWETFEQMATDFDSSIDDVLSDAMRAYARAKNYASESPETSQTDLPADPSSSSQTGPLPRPSVTPQLAPVGPLASRPTPVLPMQAPLTPPPGLGRSTQPRPVARPPSSPNLAESPSAGPTLFLLFNNMRFAIDKDQFIIGRGSNSSDLPIKDGNISRKHAAVIRRHGVFYIKDLGSTNGIDYKGMRIDNKRIDEGDVFHLCDYELKFTYRE